MRTLGFIGGGNMAKAIISGLQQAGYDSNALWVSEPNAEHLAALEKTFAVNTDTRNAVIAEQADIIILAVKPQHIHTVCRDIADTVAEKQPLIISIAAGITTQSISRWLGQPATIIRCMPNLAAIVGSSATGLYATAKATEEDKAVAESILRSVGLTEWFDDESQLDTVTALAGSGPAYFFLLMEMLAETGVALGLDNKVANTLAQQTALGAAKLAIESSCSATTLREQVTSPGGTTAAALDVLNQRQVQAIFAEAVTAAQQRAIALAAQMEST